MKTNIGKDGVAELQIDNILRNAINGKAFDINFLLKGVLTNGYARLLITTGATTRLHFKANIACEGKAYYKSFINGTYTGGTPQDDNLIILKRNATVSYDVETDVKYNPTITTAGTQRANLLILGGTGPQSTGGSAGTSESIIGPNTTFMVELQNVSGQTKDMQLILECFEEQL